MRECGENEIEILHLANPFYINPVFLGRMALTKPMWPRGEKPKIALSSLLILSEKFRALVAFSSPITNYSSNIHPVRGQKYNRIYVPNSKLSTEFESHTKSLQALFCR